MTRARERGAKRIFSPGKHKQLPATEQGEKKKRERENKSSKSAKNESEAAPKEA